MPEVKVPRGYEVTRPKILEISEGERPALARGTDALYPAPWLPVSFLDKRHEEYIVIDAGKILARQDTYLVPANGGVAADVVYADADVGEVLDVSVFPGSRTFVTTAKTESGARTANKPVGWAPFHFYNRATPQDKWINYELQAEVTTLNRYLIEMPITKTAQDAFADGELVKSDLDGDPVPFDPAADDVDQVAGRVLHVFDILTGSNSHDRLDLVRVVKGSGVSGDATSGVEKHLRQLHSGTSDFATKGMWINITLL